MKDPLEIYVIYFNTSDYPGRYVCRIQVPLGVGVIACDPVLFANEETLDAVREKLPDHLVRIERDPQDDPVIVESWM